MPTGYLGSTASQLRWQEISLSLTLAHHCSKREGIERNLVALYFCTPILHYTMGVQSEDSNLKLHSEVQLEKRNVQQVALF